MHIDVSVWGTHNLSPCLSFYMLHYAEEEFMAFMPIPQWLAIALALFYALIFCSVHVHIAIFATDGSAHMLIL